MIRIGRERKCWECVNKASTTGCDVEGRGYCCSSLGQVSSVCVNQNGLLSMEGVPQIVLVVLQFSR